MTTWWKQSLLSLYYWGTQPQRRLQNARWRRAGRAPAMVLFYHRIADDRANPWTASNATFARQMNWLQRHFDMVSLAEVQRRLHSGRNYRPCVSITFDDGYADNCHYALPLLIAKRIPCTYFVSTGNILSGAPFPHDVAAGRPLPPNTLEQIRDLARAGVEIGAHTRTHANLGAITEPDRLHDELVVSRDELADLIGRSIRYFAFPYGQPSNLSQAAYSLAREAGFDGVCSAYGGFNFPGDDPFHLQRIHVDDDLIRLKNWVTVDPRKLRAIERYPFEPDAPAPHSHRLPEAAGACP